MERRRREVIRRERDGFPRVRTRDGEGQRRIPRCLHVQEGEAEPGRDPGAVRGLRTTGEQKQFFLGIEQFTVYYFLHLFFRSSVSSERPSSNSSFALRKQNRVRSLSPSRSLPSLSSAPPSTSGSSGGGGSRKRRGRRRRRRSLPRWQPSRNCQTSSCSCRCHRNPPQCLRLIQMPTEEKIPLPLPLPKQGRRRSRRIAPLFFPLPPLPPRRLLLPLSRSPALRGETSLQPSRPRLRPHKTILPPRPRPPPRVSPSPQTGRTI